MTFDDILEQAIEMLQRRKRVSYRALKRQFDLDDDYLEDLKLEIIEIQQVAVDQDGRMLVWTGETGTVSDSVVQPDQSEPQSVVEQTQSVQSTSSPVEPHTPEAERRQLTVMFVDLVGSTNLSGALDPEDYREVVRAYQDASGNVIERFDCHLAQTLGDGLLIYSGYPVAHENDAERAIRVGLGILDAMKTLNERLEQDKGVRLAVRVGIHTGPVVVGEVGAGTRQEQLALGETPNIAARIQGLAEPDTVMISDATYRLIQGYFDCDALGERELRGVAEPVVIYQVLRERGVQSRLDVVGTRGLTPLVGRESECALLFERWEQVKDGQGQVVLLGGEAGIGKSRLIKVLKDHVGAGESYTCLECRSSPYFTNSTLYPIMDMVQRALRFQADDTPEQKLEKLAQNLRQYRLPLEETVPLFGVLLSLPVPEDRYPPLNLTPQRQRQKTLESIAAIILELAERQPVLFIMEDLHWTDPTTLELLDLLVDQTPTVPIYLLLTCRPEFQPSWQHRSYLTEVTVNRLSKPQIIRMTEQVVNGKHLPAEVIQQLVDKTDGVPLYIEEMTKSVLESGVLKEVDGHYELTGHISSLTIPPTLQDSLMARLDRLVTAKAIAQYASVIGRQFSYELLQAVSELDETTLQRELGRLVEAELLYQRGLPPYATYLFKHALIQDAAYESLLRSTRQGYHRRIAEVLEKRFPDTAEVQPELIAHHYTVANCYQEAAVYWHRAGENASAGSAYVEAVAHFQNGLDVLQLLPETAERAELELALQMGFGASLIVSQGWTAPVVEQAYVRAYELCQQLGESSTLITVLQGLRRLYAIRGDRGATQKARDLGEQLLALAQSQNDPVLLQEAHWALGQTLHFLGELNVAYRHLEQSSASYTPQPLLSQASRDQTGTQIACLFFTGMALWQLGYPDQALKASHDGLALAHELSHLFTLAFAMEGVALLHQFRREVQATRQQTEAMIDLVDAQGFAVLEPVGSILLAWTLIMEGERQEAIIQIRQAMSTLRGGIDSGEWAFHYARLAEAYGAVGQAAEGLQSVAEALELIEKTGCHVFEPELHRVQGELLLQYGCDLSQVEACFHRARDVSRCQEAKALELRAATSLARLWQSQGKRQEAYDLLAPVYEWFTEGFDTADLQDAKALLDKLA